MNPFLVVAALGVGAYLLSLSKVAKAATKLEYDILKIKIHKFKLTEPIIIRFIVQFTNLTAQQILIQQVYLNAYLNFATGNSAKKIKLATAQQNNIVIKANNSTNLNLDVSVRWLQLGSTALEMLKGVLTRNGVKFPNSAQVEGFIKAENINININKNVPFDGNNPEN